ncbi:hypothetical protein ACLOJK_017014 [Asimina triloba]
MKTGASRLGAMQTAGFLPLKSESRRCVRFTTKAITVTQQFGVLGLTPWASKSDVKQAYKRLALKYHPDVLRGDNYQDKQEFFKDIKSAYENLMVKFEENEATAAAYSRYDDEEWLGYEAGIPVVPTFYPAP